MKQALGQIAGRLGDGLTAPFPASAYLDYVAPLRTGAELRGRVVSVRRLTKDSAAITLRTGAGFQQHLAGQFVRLGVDIAGRRQWRTYSITDSKQQSGSRLIEIGVKQVPGGVVSSHLVRRLRPGQLVHLAQPAGDFTMSTPLPRKILFVSGGSGVTPIVAMLRAHNFSGADVVHLHGTATADQVIFNEVLSADLPGVTTIIRPATESLLTPEFVAETVPDFAEREAWLCGPGPMVEAISTLYDQAGASHQVHTEPYTATVALSAQGEGGEVAALLPGVPGEARTFTAPGTASLLDSAEAAGLEMVSGCRMGVCYGCVVPLVEGAITDLRTGEVMTTSADEPPVSFQPCVSAAAGPCTIDLTLQGAH